MTIQHLFYGYFGGFAVFFCGFIFCRKPRWWLVVTGILIMVGCGRPVYRSIREHEKVVATQQTQMLKAGEWELTLKDKANNLYTAECMRKNARYRVTVKKWNWGYNSEGDMQELIDGQWVYIFPTP